MKNVLLLKVLAALCGCIMETANYSRFSAFTLGPDRVRPELSMRAATCFSFSSSLSLFPPLLNLPFLENMGGHVPSADP